MTLDLPPGDDLAPAVTLLKDAKSAIGLPQVRMTPPGGDAPGTVTVARKPIDAQAATLLDAALKVVQKAKARDLSVNTAMAEWQEIAEARTPPKPPRRSRTAQRRPPLSPDRYRFRPGCSRQRGRDMKPPACPASSRNAASRPGTLAHQPLSHSPEKAMEILLAVLFLIAAIIRFIVRHGD